MNLCVSLASVIALAGLAAAQVSPRVIFTKIPTHPTSIVPGAKDLDGVDAVTNFRAMEDLIADPNRPGHWVLKARTQQGSDMETCLIASRGGAPFMLAQEGQFCPGGDPAHRYDFFASAMGRYNTAGEHIFGFRARPNRSGTAGTLTDGQRIAVWDGTTITVRLKQGDLISGLQDTGATGDERFGNSVGSAHLLDDGRIGTQDSTVSGIHTSRRPILAYNDVGFQQSNVSPVQAFDGSASTFTTFLANTFYSTPDGAHWIVQGRRAGQALSDDLFAYDGTTLIETGSPVAGTSVIASDVFAASILADGTWIARGDDPSDNDWLVINNTMVAKTGDPITPGSNERWGNTFFAYAANTAGDWILIGNTDNPAADRDTVVVLNGETVLLREGDPLDLDGNGQFDDNVYIGRANSANAAFLADGVQLTESGEVYMVVNIRDADGVEYNSSPAFSVPAAFIAFSLPGGGGCASCAADYNQDGGVDGGDVEAFYTDWENAQPCADVNEDGGIDGGDVEFFFTVWEAGTC